MHAPLVAARVTWRERQDEARETRHKTAVLGGKGVFTGSVPLPPIRTFLRLAFYSHCGCGNRNSPQLRICYLDLQEVRDERAGYS